MSLPQRLDAYPDCIKVFDRVLETGPTRVEFETYKKANVFQLRMCNARALHRDETKRLYKPDDPRHGRSPYDPLVVRKPQEDEAGHWWVYVEEHGSDILSIEDAA